MSPRPKQTTMEGMLWNANHVLDSALDPKNSDPEKGGIPRDLLQKCHGVVLVSIVEAGFIFKGSVGAGVIMAQYPGWDGWSAPSAVSLHGVGFGFFAGKGARDVVILIMDPTLEEVSGAAEIRFGGEVNHIIPGLGGKREGQNESCDFVRGSYVYVFSDGFFRGVSLDSSILMARGKENKRFYGKAVTPRDIMFEGKVTPPEGSGVSMLHRKLNLLKGGERQKLTTEEAALKESLKVEADKAAEAAEADQVDELHYVEAEKEAAKEAEEEKEAVEKDEADADNEAGKDGGAQEKEETVEADKEGEKEKEAPEKKDAVEGNEAGKDVAEPVKEVEKEKEASKEEEAGEDAATSEAAAAPGKEETGEGKKEELSEGTSTEMGKDDGGAKKEETGEGEKPAKEAES